MNGRLKIIEQQLIGIDAAAFQNLCDAYLFLREQELTSINRSGSQFGKQKTTPGTPDTFYRLSDRSLRYVEYTTKATGLVAKIIEDIDKCLDETKTGVPADEISKIIVCFNSKIDVEEEREIVQYATNKNVAVQLIGLDWLALEIYSKYPLLAKDILGVSFDTGQLLPLQNFVDEYNNKGGNLSTPLNNEFLHRKVELTQIQEALASHNLIILSGFPGVGKTKIALEALTHFLQLNPGYEAFAVSKKDMDIGEDLRIHLQTKNNYVLLVDDANRQLLNFKQILGVFREKREGNIKLLVTVRSYAVSDVKAECTDYDPLELTLGKFTDEEIVGLLESGSFEIRNPKYQRKIIDLADGNARLAVMAAKVAQQKQEIFLLGDVSDLYDTYFQTFIKDADLFADKKLMKALGLVSFFFTIDRANKAFIKELLDLFEIDYYEFNEAVDDLQRRELVEVQYNHVRVSEQVMATYFFYKVFIKDDLLSFKTLLFSYFPVWKKRFSDTIIPSNNSFGYEKVILKINGVLDEYLQTIYEDDGKVKEFFSLFWFYKREETLAYFHQQIMRLPEPESLVYETAYETNDFVWDRDSTLDYLIRFFDHPTESFLPALELAFELARRKPEVLPELIRRIKEKLLFDEEDQATNFLRQEKFIALLIKNFKEDKAPYVDAFFALAQTFLQHHFQITKGGRRNTISFYHYPLPSYSVTQELRKQMWETLFAAHSRYPSQVMAVLKNFKPGHMQAIPEILAFDLSFILPFIENELDPSLFKNIFVVRDFLRWLDMEDVADRSYRQLNHRFMSREYALFRKLDWNQVRGRQDYEFSDYDDFQRLKEDDIRTSFMFTTANEFEDLHKAIRHAQSVSENGSSVNQSLDLIVEENFKRNNELGFAFLQSLLQNYPDGLHPLYKPITAIVQASKEWALRLWELLASWKHDGKLYWQLAFFECLPSSLCNVHFKEELLNTLQSIDKPLSYLRFDSIAKFLPVDENIVDTALVIVVDKIEKYGVPIRLSFHFFENFAGHIHETSLLGKAYLQQQRLHNGLDFERKELRAVMARDPDFLFQYLDTFYTGGDLMNRNTHVRLSFLWDLDDYVTIITRAANQIIDHNPYFGIGNHSLYILFSHLNEARQEKAKHFILDYIGADAASHRKMNTIFDVVRKFFSPFFETAFLHYLYINQNLDDFKEVFWIGNGGVYSGDVIISDIHVREWQKIMAMLEKAPNQLGLIPIKAYIRQQIAYELKSAEAERKRKFIDPDNFG